MLKKRSFENTLISIVLPIFNEADNIKLFLQKIEIVSNSNNLLIEYLFIDDGSTDGSLQLLRELQCLSNRIRIIALTRNFGKEAALTAGLHHVGGKIVIPMDVDGQDPVDLIIEMLNEWEDGYDVVLARRADRKNDSFLKRFTSLWFYRINSLLSDIPIPDNVGDFRLMDSRVVNAVLLMPESMRFMKGLFAWVGFKTKILDYERPLREGGISKFNYKKLWKFGVDGITSFSILPITCWTYIGAGISLISFFYGLFIVLRVLVYGIDTPGFASLMVAITFLGGVQLIGIGVLGEYVGRTYIESKRRPLYLIDQIYDGK